MPAAEAAGATTVHITRPILASGAAVDIVRGSLFVDGYAAAPGGIANITIDIDGQYIRTAQHDVEAKPVLTALSDGVSADVSRFTAMAPAWALSAGQHRVTVRVGTKNGVRAETSFSIVVDRTAASEGAVLRRKMPLSELHVADRVLSGLGWRPNFGILIGLGETEAEIDAGRRTLASLREQVYGGWRATVLRRGRIVPDRAAFRLLEGFNDIADRIDVRLDVPPAASLADLVRPVATHNPIHLIGVLLAGDSLGCDALLEMAIASGLQPDAEFFYSDERRIDPAGGRSQGFYKPQWSLDLLTATNYIGRFWCALVSVLRRTRATMGDWFQFGDYDIVLRCTEETLGIHHVPKLLCERGRHQLDHPDQERAALARAAGRRNIEAVIGDGAATGCYRVKRTVDPEKRVSVVIAVQPGGDRTEKCIQSLRATTARHRIEIICVVRNALEDDRKSWLGHQADIVAICDEPYNRSRYNNRGAREATGEFLLFLDGAAVFNEPDWLDALLEHAMRDEVGPVGPRLLDPDGTVAQAGTFWVANRVKDAFHGTAANESGYFGLAQCERNVVAVSGACLLMRRTVFDALGGFDEDLAVNGDVDFCLRCREQGKAVIYTPHASLTLDELPNRSAANAFEDTAFANRWGRKLQSGDPFYHRGLGSDLDDFTAEREPIELVYAGRPLFDRARIRNILAVKLDHIGDFVTAIPALRRLQGHFPQARLYLLASRGVAELTHLVPGLAGAVEFEFFFARSGAGQRELSPTDFQTLRQRLHPYQFDLAIDFRKAPETRPVLRESGARWLAGFAHHGQFPWLDVVVEWEGDPPAARKRLHVSDDLLRLVEAVAIASDQSPGLPRRPHTAPRAGVAPTIGRKLVCIHPGVGSEIRQWPARHFATLIDLLAASDDTDVVLIGGGDEIAIAEEVLVQVQRRDVVRSVVGEVRLRDLPGVLASADLFVGNNSGPKHLAAGLGVPTVGIHSGTVDAREWGPVGANAVAIRKNMVCSPCYFSDARDCPRELACLTELRPFDVYEICHRFLTIDTARG